MITIHKNSPNFMEENKFSICKNLPIESGITAMGNGRKWRLRNSPPSLPFQSAGDDWGRLFVAGPVWTIDLLLLQHGHAAVGHLSDGVHHVVEWSLKREKQKWSSDTAQFSLHEIFFFLNEPWDWLGIRINALHATTLQLQDALTTNR